MRPVSFRTTEISDPRFERDHLRSVTVHSAALGGRGDITFFVPPGLTGTSAVPLVILLHGSNGSHWAWALQGGAHRTALRLIESGAIPPVVLAMPSDGLAADTTGYFPASDEGTPDFARWIVDEVPTCAAHLVGSVTEASPLFMAGLSMGGFGALHLGLRHGKRFTGVAGHSSVTDLSLRNPRANPADLDIYRFKPVPELSVLYWARKNRDRLPRIRFDCGRDDALIEPNRKLHRDLSAEQIPHTYDEYPGGHDWPYWETHIEDTLRFFARTS